MLPQDPDHNRQQHSPLAMVQQLPQTGDGSLAALDVSSVH